MSSPIVPINMVAEKAAISCLSQQPELFGMFPWEESLFFTPAYRRTFQTIREAISEGAPCDLIALSSRLTASGELEAVGGYGGLSEICTTLAFADAWIAENYFRDLVKARSFRDLLAHQREHETDIERMQADLGEYVSELGRIAATAAPRKVTDLKGQISGVMSELEQTAAPEFFQTGLESLDFALGGGSARGELVVIAADTSRGKSVLLLQFALEAARTGKSVAVFSLEMSASEIIKRMAANLGGSPVKPVCQRPSKGELTAVSSALVRISGMPITIVDDRTNFAEIEAEARRLAQAGQADLIVIDYLQLVECDGDNREQVVSEIARRMKNLATSANSVVATASQVNETGKLRESRAIGHHANTVLVIGDSDNGEEIQVVKNRRGERGQRISVKLRGELARFEGRGK